MKQQKKQEKQHQVYFSKEDYIKLTEDFERSNSLTYNPQQLLLIAKGYFIEEHYAKCLTVLKNISPQHSSKVLYQRQSLQFRASYLINKARPATPELIAELDLILTVFFTSAESVPGPKFHPHHHATFDTFKQFLFILEVNLSAQIYFNLELFNSQKKIQATKKGFQGFPIYLVSNQWIEMFINIPKPNNQTIKLNPLTNFNIINHIFEAFPFQANTNLHKNVYVFPGAEYRTVSKQYWNYLNSIVNQGKQFGPIKRISKEDKQPHHSVVQKSKLPDEAKKKVSKFYDLIPIAIKYEETTVVLQLNHNKPLDKQLYRIIEMKFGAGQLRIHSGNVSQLFDIEAPSQTHLQGFNKILHFEKIRLPINTTFEQIQPLLKFQFKPIPQEHFKSPENGLKGLENIGNSCYLGSSLQCLSFTKELSIDLSTTPTFQLLDLELKDCRVITALADLFKSLWSKDQRKFIFPRKFKKTFGEKRPQFSAKSQEDAHQFLLCLLNDLHDDMKVSSRLLKAGQKLSMTTDQTKVNQYFQKYQLQINKSKIMDIFRGTIHNTMNCSTCKTQSHSYDTFLALTLPIPQRLQTFIDIYFFEFEAKFTKRYRVHIDNIKTIEELFTRIKQSFLKLKAQFYYIFGQINQQTLIFEELGLIQQKSEMFSEITFQDLQKKVNLIIYEVKKKESYELYALLEYRLQKDGLVLGFPRVMPIDERKLQDRFYYIDLKKEIAEYDKQNYFRSIDINKLCMKSLKQSTSKTGIKSNIFNCIIQVIFNSQQKLFKGTTDIYQEFGDTSIRYDIYDCLNLMKQPEILEHSWTCGQCNKNERVEKVEEIMSTNNILIIHLKRFKADYRKVKCIVEYPLKGLDLTKFVQRQDRVYKYNLYAVCLHTGTAEYGHYRAYCQHFVSGEWFQFDDGMVRRIEQRDVVTENAYILFYRIAGQI